MRDELKFELLRDARALEPEHLPQFFSDLEEIRRTAELQLLIAAKRGPDPDALLNVAQAAEVLNVSEDMLYRNEFSFTRHIGGKRLFSRNGIDKAIRENDLLPRQTDVKLAHRNGTVRPRQGSMKVTASRQAVAGESCRPS